MQKSSLKDRTDNRFDQTFTKIVNPKFNEKLKLFRRIHISISQHEQSNH
jgi:hypothetical protein